MEPLKTTEKSFFTELVDHLIPVIKEFKNQEIKPIERSKIDNARQDSFKKVFLANEDWDSVFDTNRIQVFF